MSSGYSKRPLYQKLGIKEEFNILIINGPENYFELLGDFPKVKVLNDLSEPVDFIHLFSENVEHFENQFFIIKEKIKKDGMIWVSWFKKSSKFPTDLNENIIRDTALSLGLVDIKVCAVDENWSGLKIVWRKENR